MARTVAFLGGLVCGLALATSLMVSHADDVQAEVLEAAAVAHVDPTDLAGAVSSTGLDPQTYLRAVGEWPAPTPPPAAGSPRVACIIRVESRGDASALNPRSRAAGLGQFLPSTWNTTPQGRAGLSVYNPDANRAAISWMISVGRAKEFDAVRFGGC
ncbi:MAG TPA: hypothetical protein VGK33_01325 [Chloroflexota bacterium]|jgi:hypothetical protein